MTASKLIGPYVRRYWYWYLFGLCCLGLTSGLQLLIPLELRSAINLLTTGTINIDIITGHSLTIVALALSVALGRIGWRLLIQGAARRIEAEIRADLFKHFLTLGRSFYQEQKIGDLMALSTNDLNAVRMAISMALVAAFDAIFMTISILLILFASHGQRTFLYIIPLPIITFLILFLGRLVGKLFKNVQESFGIVTRHTQEAFAGIKVIQAFMCQQEFLARFFRANQTYQKHNMRLTSIWGGFFPSVGFLAGLTILSVLLAGGHAIILGQMNAGDLVASISYIQLLIWPMLGSGFAINLIQRGKASLERIGQVMERQPDIEIEAPQSPIHTAGKLSIRNLNFSYPQQNQGLLTLQNLNIELLPGKWLGITGPTGSGKSSLWQALTRTFPIGEDMIFLDDLDICQYDPNDLRRRFAVVPQDSFLFSETLRWNICFAQDHEDPIAFENATRTATIDRDVNTFPDGWNTMIGEKGLTLSGGQRQRVALARALLVDAPILILDDSFAAVDAQTERFMIERLKLLRTNKTTIVISHRISAMEVCDQIVVIEAGQSSQMGSHHELCKIEGYYQDVWRLQGLEQKEQP
jgi:ATP-binding cassette, subfamily B, multidrug efflux pump